MNECSTCSCLGINYLLKFLMQISCANSPEINKSRYHLTGGFSVSNSFHACRPFKETYPVQGFLRNKSLAYIGTAINGQD